MPNRLIHEKSPYLLQHAYNPVDWYPWGPEAFAKAQAEDKPIFLSIGYSTCHWCHVMEKESFENPTVARLMNDAFVAIKVDREERPDIDGIYMDVALKATGGGGWPLSVVMTPGQKPFFVGTYIPRATRFGRSGMLDLVPRLHELWLTDRQRLLDNADQVARIVQEPVDTSGESLNAAVLQSAYDHLAARFDDEYGGFGDAPKFPAPHNLCFLLRHWKRSGDEAALHMVEATLQAMRCGGIYDHVGFGFHRYATDRRWLLPHFEKMLYDQAMLSLAYLEAYQATGRAFFAQTAREIFEYVLRDMTDARGGFYCAEDADSEGEEGKFYVWPKNEVERLLGADDAAWVVATFGLENEGNYVEEASGLRTGENILWLSGPLPVQDAARWDTIRRKLSLIRGQRVHPYKDDKVLTDWNGLMIAALARGAQVLDDPAYAVAAAGAADFVLETMRDVDGCLLHRYRDGEAAIAATLDDYAFLIWGLLELYEATFEAGYVSAALELCADMRARFWDEEHGGFFQTAVESEPLLARRKAIYDGAIPSGNSVALAVLLRLGRITGNAELDEAAAALGRAFAGLVRAVPPAYTHLLQGIDFALGPVHEVVIVGESEAEDTHAMLQALRRPFLPNKVVLLRPPGNSPEITRIAPFTRFQRSIKGTATAYVCRNYACARPTTDVAEMLELLAGTSRA